MGVLDVRVWSVALLDCRKENNTDVQTQRPGLLLLKTVNTGFDKRPSGKQRKSCAKVGTL
jgi:hypothetical protein